jgi:hypothetical protein
MKKLFAFCLIGMLAFHAFSQKIVTESGDLNFLKDQTTINVEYDYSSMAVGKYKTENEYVNNKVAEHNKDEAGKGDKWKDGWVGARKERYEPKFEELINDVLKNNGILFKQNASDAKYTLIVKTSFTEPGWNIGISKMSASANLDYIFVETANREVIVGSFYQRGVPGSQAMGYDFDAGTRIAECYAKGGKSLGQMILKTQK